MATEIITKLTDDLDGGTATETVAFSLDGSAYEIDLNKRNAAKLRKTVTPYMEVARKARANGHKPRRRDRKAEGSRSAEIRAWAKARGIEVNERGRIPTALVTKFESSESP